MKHVNIFLLATIILSLLISGCNNNYNSFSLLSKDSINNSVNIDKSSAQCKNTYVSKRQAQINDLEDKYRIILESQKDYSEMSESEMKITQDIISDWNKLSLNFKSKYIKEKKSLQESMNAYNSDKKSDIYSEKADEIKASYDTGITYENINVTPDEYLNKKVKFSGRILQAYGADPDNDMKIAVDGNENNPILVAYDPDIIQLTFINNEKVIIRGHFVKTVSDLSMVNGETKIPKIYANYIEIVK